MSVLLTETLPEFASDFQAISFSIQLKEPYADLFLSLHFMPPFMTSELDR